MSCDRPSIIATPEQARAAFSLLADTPADRIRQHILARLARGPAGLHLLVDACEEVIFDEIVALIKDGRVVRFGGQLNGIGYRLAERQP